MSQLTYLRIKNELSVSGLLFYRQTRLHSVKKEL